MRGVILGMCAVVAAGVFLAMYLCVWSTRDDPARAAAFRQHIVSELVWVTIPILMLIAAAFPAVIAVMSGTAAQQQKAQYIAEHGDDMPEITGWGWGQRGTARPARSSAEGDNV